MYFRTPKISHTNYGYSENNLVSRFALAYNFYVNWLFFCFTIFFFFGSKKEVLAPPQKLYLRAGLFRSFIFQVYAIPRHLVRLLYRVYRCIKIPSNLVRLVCRVCRCIEIPKHLGRLLCRLYRCIRIQILKKKVCMPSGFMRKIPQLPLITKKGLQSFEINLFEFTSGNMLEVILMKKKQHLLFFICYKRQVLTLRIYMSVTSGYLPGFVLLLRQKGNKV